jgi:pimeloyl-ACP methyl ester carboxylesterase
MAPDAVEAGTLGSGLPYLKFGSGPLLVVAAGLSSDHRVPRGFGLRFELAANRTIWWLNRREGLEQDVTMADIADDYADVLRPTFDGPVDVMGISTGGSVALQLTIDHPELVSRLVLAGSGCRLGTSGKRVQLRLAELARAGRQRAAAAEILDPGSGPVWSRALLRGGAWLLGSAAFSIREPSDLVATIEAEDSFDVTDRLGEIRVPTLIVGGARDAFYDDGRILAETAAGIRGARLILYPHRGHMSATGRRARRDIAEFLAADAGA